jgi:hypothetical protein
LDPEVPIAVLTAESHQRAAEACRYLETIVSRVHVLSVVRNSLEIATKLAPLDPACVRNVVAMVPERVEGSLVLPSAKFLCEQQHRPTCGQLTHKRH